MYFEDNETKMAVTLRTRTTFMDKNSHSIRNSGGTENKRITGRGHSRK